jgi:hypothetical protein
MTGHSPWNQYHALRARYVRAFHHATRYNLNAWAREDLAGYALERARGLCEAALERLNLDEKKRIAHEQVK